MERRNHNPYSNPHYQRNQYPGHNPEHQSQRRNQNPRIQNYNSHPDHQQMSNFNNRQREPLFNQRRNPAGTRPQQYQNNYHLIDDPHIFSQDFDPFEMGLFSHGQNRSRRNISPQRDFFSDFNSFFSDFDRNFNDPFFRRPNRNSDFFDLVPSINLFLDSGSRRAAGRRRRDQGLLEMFFGGFNNAPAFDIRPMHSFFNSRQTRELDIGQILAALAQMAPGAERHNPGNTNRLRTVKMTRDLIASNQACTVCQEDFKAGEEVKKLPCEHCFHEDCITPWLQSQNTCPVCRNVV